MVWEAAYKYDSDEDATKAAYLAKQYADKMVLEVTDGAVQVLGGHGYVRDHPVELWLRNGRGATSRVRYRGCTWRIPNSGPFRFARSRTSPAPTASHFASSSSTRCWRWRG